MCLATVPSRRKRQVIRKSRNYREKADRFIESYASDGFQPTTPIQTSDQFPIEAFLVLAWGAGTKLVAFPKLGLLLFCSS